MLKDGWVRSQSRDGKLIDIALECSVVQQVTRNVVEPQALPEIMEFLCRLHCSSRLTLWPRRALLLTTAANNSAPKASASSSSRYENHCEDSLSAIRPPDVEASN